MTVIVQACVTADFTEPITTFRSSLDTAGAAIATYYVEGNRFERELYLQECLHDATAEVAATDKTGAATPLYGRIFPAASIEARIDALALLGTYAGRLAELAGSTAPENIETATISLGSNVDSLVNRFEKLPSSDGSAAAYAEPIGTIVGALLRMYTEHQRDRAIRVAIEEAAPHVRTLLDLLENDLENVLVPLRTTGLQERLAMGVEEYNQNRSSWSLAERREALERIGEAARRYESALAARPTGLVQGIRQGHEALVTYARSERGPQDLSQLVVALETFERLAETVSTAIRQLR